MSDDIDRIMSMVPEQLMGDYQSLTALIAYVRQQRENIKDGVKPKKDVGEVSLTLETLGMMKPKAAPAAKPMRRF